MIFKKFIKNPLITYLDSFLKYIFLLSLFLICLISYKFFFLTERERCWNSIDFKKMEKTLSQSPIIKSIPFHKYPGIPEYDRKKHFSKMLKKGKKPSYLIFFFNNDVRAFAKISKPKKDIKTLSIYHFSQLMNFKLVPPTVIRNKYLIQLFIDNDMNQIYRKNKLSEVLKPIEKSDIYIFYFIFGTLDPSISNILIGEKCNRVALIDNNWVGISHTQYGDYPFLYYRTKKQQMDELILNADDYKNFPFHKVQSLKFSSSKQLKMFFHDTGMNVDPKNDIFLTSFEDLIDQTLYFILYKMEGCILAKA